MSHICSTRALKNVKAIRSVCPRALPIVEPLNGFASVVPYEVLQRFHQMTDEELRPYPQLLEAAQALRRKALQEAATIVARKPPTNAPNAQDTPTTWGDNVGTSRPQTASSLVNTPLFHGTLIFVKVTFITVDPTSPTGTKSYEVSDADHATIMQYTQLALPAISEYTAQYGESQVNGIRYISEFPVDVPTGVYTDGTLQSWLFDLAAAYGVDPSHTCFIVCNPVGITNTFADPADAGGYHWSVNSDPYHFSYCVVNVKGSNLTIKDAPDLFATNLSHELAEMLVDPAANGENPEVCDACASCRNTICTWRAFFVASPDGPPRYVQSDDCRTDLPFLDFDFYIAAVALPKYVDARPPGITSPCPPCAFGPYAREGIGQLLFFEQTDTHDYFELYSVNGADGIALQTTFGGDMTPPSTPPSPPPSRPNPAGTIDPQNLPPSPPPSRPNPAGTIDPLNPPPSSTPGQHPHPPNPAGTIDPQNPVGAGGSRELIVPGYFTTKPFGSPMDVLRYDPSPSGSGTGTGQFFRTGSLGEFQVSSFNANLGGNWTQIIPGRFSDSSTTDLLFYARTTGTGEFYHTVDGGLPLAGHGKVVPPFAIYTDWRTTWTQIIPGKFSDSPYTDLLFYEPASGRGEFYHTDGGGLGPNFATYTDWRSTWSLIIPGRFSEGLYTDLLFYEPSSGTGEFFHTDGGLVFPHFAMYTDWRTTWTQIIPGRFSNSPYTDLLFYDPSDASSGTGEFYHTGGGLGPNFATYTDWRTTWSIIAHL